MLLTAIRVSSRQRVIMGPFAGTRLLLSPQSARLLPSYLLGTAELELHGAIEQLLTTPYRTILNIGAADGYYAVGLARRLPSARVIAFEIVPELRRTVGRSAAANHVAGRVEIAGRCGQEALRQSFERADGPVLVVADIEGEEAVLLDPQAVPHLRTADLLVELHDAIAPGASDLLIERFSATHDIQQFVARPRTVQDFPAGFLPILPALFPRAALELMNERRSETQKWLCCRARMSAVSVRSREPDGQE
jgi:predicted O-methyltransferase YrrM